MVRHSAIEDDCLREDIRTGTLRFGGNIKLKIYGRLCCNSGRRMKKENRVFFVSEEEALSNGFRPCGNCMKEAYQSWISLKG